MRSDWNGASVRRLERLSRLDDYDVGRNDPDPRGWTVVNREGRSVGEVKDLMVDTERMAATYLDVELDTKQFNLRHDDPHVLVPVERAHRDGKRLVVDDINSNWVTELCTARERDRRDFWDRWWHRDEVRQEPARDTRITRPVLSDEMRREEFVVSRASDEPRQRGR